MKAAVLGAGSWGTTFAQVLCDAGTPTVLYSRRPEVAKAISAQHENPDYLPGIALTDALCATADAAQALAGAGLVCLAVPAQTLRENLTEWAGLIPPDALLVSLIKGIEHGTLLRMSEVIASVLGAPSSRVAAVTGPNLAKEIARREFTAAVVACTDAAGAKALQQACHTRYFRPYTNSDVIGSELGGAVKNIIALGVGIAVSLGLGDNTRATLITRGLAEMARLGSALGAQPQTFAGLAGMGDLVATCSSPLSRNRGFGENLGRGMSVAAATAALRQTAGKTAGQTAEGVESCRPVLALARAHGVEMPITEVMAAVMHDGLPVAEAAVMLASRAAKPEWYS
jgi:glycerol-3-phosphate dehydrogenase (NAD(P)+)